MKTWIALLRGVNMIGKKKLPMHEFRQLLERLGAEGVRTYHQSGNAVFRHRARKAARLEERIAKAIATAFPFETFVMVLEVEQLSRIIAENPFPEAETEPGAMAVGLLGITPQSPNLKMLEAARRSSERFALKGDVFYFYAPEGFHKTKLGGKLERALGVGKAGTGRTLGTLIKVLAMAQESVQNRKP